MRYKTFYFSRNLFSMTYEFFGNISILQKKILNIVFYIVFVPCYSFCAIYMNECSSDSSRTRSHFVDQLKFYYVIISLFAQNTWLLARFYHFSFTYTPKRFSRNSNKNNLPSHKKKLTSIGFINQKYL